MHSGVDLKERQISKAKVRLEVKFQIIFRCKLQYNVIFRISIYESLHTYMFS